MANDILKKTLLHYINLEYYANGLDEEFQTLLNELMERCRKAILEQTTLNTKTSYNAIMGVIKDEVEEYRKELEERLDEVAEFVMNQELEFLDETYNKPEKESGSLLKTAALALGGVSLAKILFAPIDGRDSTKQFAERTAKNILRSYDTSLRSGYLFGQNTEDVSAQIDGKMKQIARGIQSGIRTAVPSYAKTTDRIVFLNNDVEVVWVATLDGRTCLPAGEQILTPNGNVSIEDLVIGDLVIGGSRIPRKILNTASKNTEELIEIELENGKTIKCTPEHEILTNRGWVEAGSLEVTDVIKESL